MARVIILALLPALPLLACSFNPPPRAASQAGTASAAEYADCRQQANRAFSARHYAYISRTDQMATPLSGLPNQEYVSNRLADLHEYDDRVRRCVENGNQANSTSGAGLPEPQIIGPSN